MEVPFARPYFRGTEGGAVADVISTGWVSQGPRVREFEAAFAERVGAAQAVATSSCTAALHLALYGLGVGPGDEVILPSLSFIATANAVWQCGATPIFGDVDPGTYNLDPGAVERIITRRTKLIMPVHQVGLPADMDAFMDIAARHGLMILEDAACALGARYKGWPIGSVGPVTCFSLHPRKVITTGEGGIVALQDGELAKRLRQLRQHAMSVSDLDRHHSNRAMLESYPERGFNYRMTDMQAAVGLCQLEVLDQILERRRRLAQRYTEALADIPYLATPSDPPYAERSWQSYCVRICPGAPLSRDQLMQRLLDDGIATRRGVMAIHEQPAYCGDCVLPHTEVAAREVMMLPLYPDLSFADQDYVVARLNQHAAAMAA